MHSVMINGMLIIYILGGKEKLDYTRGSSVQAAAAAFARPTRHAPRTIAAVTWTTFFSDSAMEESSAITFGDTKSEHMASEMSWLSHAQLGIGRCTPRT
jgi:hypothetical protein